LIIARMRYAVNGRITLLNDNIPQDVDFPPHVVFSCPIPYFDEVLAYLDLNYGSKIPTDLGITDE
jgi:hypothetical protein